MRRKAHRNRWPILDYEILMYLGAKRLQMQPPPRPKLMEPEEYRGLIQNMLTEVKVLHTRILTEVFLEEGKFPDDLKISDLMPAWPHDYGDLVKNLRHAYATDVILEHGVKRTPRECLNKYLAHPDKTRGDHLNWEPITRQMDPCLQEILLTLPEDRLPALAWLPRKQHQ